MIKTLGRRRLAVAVAMFGMVAGAGYAIPTTAAHAATASPDGHYHPASPKRLLDTRYTTKGSVGANGTVTIPLSDFAKAGMPSVGVQSVVVNLTVTGTTGPGWATMYTGSTVPATSNLNFPQGWTGASTSTVAISSAGLTVRVSGAAGTRAQVIVDLQGWYSNAAYVNGQGGGFLPDDPWRLYDSRTDKSPLGGGFYDTFELDWGTDQPASISAVLINLTATGSTGRGNLVAWDGQENDEPNTSSVNFVKGETSPNTAIVPVHNDGNGKFSFGIANAGYYQTNYIVDVLGYYGSVGNEPGLRHVMVAPTRVMNWQPVGQGQTRTATATKVINADNTIAVEGTLTAARPTSGSFLTAWSGLGDVPGISTLNVAKGQNRSNGFLALRDDDPFTVGVRNAYGSLNAIIDVTGRFDADPPAATTGRSMMAHLKAPTVTGGQVVRKALR